MNLSDMKNEIIEKYPEFIDAEFVENTKGWSNKVLIIDDKYIFRFPRNNESRRMLELEKLIVPYFRKKTNMNVPNFKYKFR